MSSGIMASLRESKPGPEYNNTLMDKHVALAAVTSSMDICFAKMKSLDCRKEEAIAALLAIVAPKRQGSSSARRQDALKSKTDGTARPQLKSSNSYSSQASVKVVVEDDKDRSRGTTAQAAPVAGTRTATSSKTNSQSSSTHHERKRSTDVSNKTSSTLGREKGVAADDRADEREVSEQRLRRSHDDTRKSLDVPRKLRVKGVKAAKISVCWPATATAPTVTSRCRTPSIRPRVRRRRRPPGWSSTFRP